jgi:hypothetical protein
LGQWEVPDTVRELSLGTVPSVRISPDNERGRIDTKGGAVNKRSVVIVPVVALVLVLALAGTALAWGHGRSAAPILDRYTIVAGPISDTWYTVNYYFDTAGAKPLYTVYASSGGTGMQKITHADLVAGHKTMLVPRTATGVYLETRKGAQSNVLPFSVP